MANEKDEVLFSITKEQLETGLRGYPVGYCTSSSVDPMKGLFYVGKPVSEMTNWQPERVMFLLLFGFDGSAKEIEEFSKEIKERSKLSKEVKDAIWKLPRDAHPMRLFSIGLLLLGSFEGTSDWKEDCLNIVAKAPLLAAEIIHHHAGWGPVKPADPKLGYMQNFTQMLSVPNANKDNLAEALRLFNILHYDHGGGNLSTFIGKAVSSSLEDMYGSLAAAMCALAGPRHGRANQDCLEFVQQALEVLGEGANEAEVEAYIRKRLDKNELIFGFGHAVLRVEDPRAQVFYQLADSKYNKNPLVKIAMMIRKCGKKVLSENPKISDPNPNVDAISGVVLSAAGFPYPQYFTLLFGVSRSVGISRQIVHDRVEARDGKGTPIVRPKYLYKAPSPQIFGIREMNLSK